VSKRPSPTASKAGSGRQEHVAFQRQPVQLQIHRQPQAMEEPFEGRDGGGGDRFVGVGRREKRKRQGWARPPGPTPDQSHFREIRRQSRQVRPRQVQRPAGRDQPPDHQPAVEAGVHEGKFRLERRQHQHGPRALEAQVRHVHFRQADGQAADRAMESRPRGQRAAHRPNLEPGVERHRRGRDQQDRDRGQAQEQTTEQFHLR